VPREDEERLKWYRDGLQRQLCMFKCLERGVEWDESSREDVKGKGSLNGN
jgi:hypothetical protein